MSVDKNPAPAGKSSEEVAAAYDSPPWWYDARGFLILTFAYNSNLTHQLRLFGPNFGARHLEVACGTGTLLDLVLRWRRWKRLPSVQIVAVDYAEAMLAGAERRFSGRADVEVRRADVSALPFPTASFDTANIANAIHCFPDVDSALREVFRVLKPGGTLAANALLYPHGLWPLRQIAARINEWGMRKGILHTPYHRNDIGRRIVESGFEVVEEGVSGNCYDVLARKR
jgi:ubiquinone/menaquinone biosynthesis C-methylase UbiE